MTITTTPRTIIGLRAENFKRIQAIDITPDPTNPIVAISGANAQGKSSVLDAIWSTLQTADANRATGTTKHIRDGADTARVQVTFDDITVTRTWSAKGTSKLEVTANDTGAKFTSPQQLLDSLMGKLTFDPLAFTRMSSKEQTTTLASMVNIGIDLDQVSAERKNLFTQRTDVGRDIKALGELPTVDPTLPAEEVTASEILAQITEANGITLGRSNLTNEIDRSTDLLDDYAQQILNLQNLMEQEGERNQSLRAQLAELPEAPNVDDLNRQLSLVEDTNQRIRGNQTARDLHQRHHDLTSQRDHLTAEINALDEAKANALAAAKFPLPGLSFNDDGITYNGQPLAQASTAEQLRVSCALAAATNPSIRVMRVTDGSLLDTASRQALADIATEHGFQIWMELVDESGDIGIVIEDGQVKE